jgi:hypothetical protein
MFDWKIVWFLWAIGLFQKIFRVEFDPKVQLEYIVRTLVDYSSL